MSKRGFASSPFPARLTIAYYLATPFFLLLDLALGVNIRAAGLEQSPKVKYSYYALCILCGVATYFKPSLTSSVGLVESSVNILLLILGMMVPYYWLTSQALEDHFVRNPFTLEKVANFSISGLVWANVFYRSIPRSVGEDFLNVGGGWKRR